LLSATIRQERPLIDNAFMMGQRVMEPTANQPRAKFRIAYALQNTGVDLTSDVGAPSLVKQMLRGLQRAGHDVTLIELKGPRVTVVDAPCVDVPYDEAVFREAPLGVTGTRWFRLAEGGARRLQRTLNFPYLALFDSLRFYEACLGQLPGRSLCHEYHGLSSLGAALACARLRIPYVVTLDADLLLESRVVGRPIRGIRALVAAQQERLAYRLADKIICVSAQAKQHFVEKWRVDAGKIAVLPNGVDTDLFAPRLDSCAAKKSLGLNATPTIGFLGGFQKWHGIELLLAAFQQVLVDMPDAQLLLVGDGPVRPAIEDRIQEQQLSERVHITGYVSQEKVPEILAAMDVAVAPYPRLPEELWFSPLKLYEYMAAGKAIVASRSGQIADVIRDGENGLLVEPGNVHEMAAGILALLKDGSLRASLGRRAREQAEDRHSWDRYIRRLEEIYDSVL
jgi:glycosyltransferase involved in cell wall biosynthesis